MGEAGAGAGARKCAVFQNKAKCVVSCPPASGRGGEEGQLGYLGDRAEFINTYSHPRAAQLGHQLYTDTACSQRYYRHTAPTSLQDLHKNM